MSDLIERAAVGYFSHGMLFVFKEPSLKFALTVIRMILFLRVICKSFV